MHATGLGDRAALLSATRQGAALRERLQTLSAELGSGRVQDPARLGPRQSLAMDLDRRAALSESWRATAAETGARLAATSEALARVEGSRRSLMAQALAATAPGSPAERALAAEAGRAAFEDVARSLDVTWGGASLFAGTATDAPALSPTLWPEVEAAVGAPATAAGAMAALDAYFDAPGGGFAAGGYRGAPAVLTRSLGDGPPLALPARADDPALRATLKAAAAAALSARLPPAEGAQLLERARDGLAAAAEPLAGLGAAVGAAEARAEAAATRHAAQGSALALRRDELLAVDPFETATLLQQVQTQLETHYAVTARLAPLSLAAWLR